MLVIPAIDLRGGRCVRLLRGDFTRETVYDDDPLRVARHWLDLGAPWLHVVDLDGARTGWPAQLEFVAGIAALGARVELGGGLRTLDDMNAALSVGVRRVIVGTAAVENQRFVAEAVSALGADAIVLGVDARGGHVATHGWINESDVGAADLIGRAMSAGVERVIYTDIDRDGTLSSPNFEAIAEVARLGVKVIASGGVSTMADLRLLATIPGVEAAIAGKALYEQTVRIEDASGWWVSPAGSAADEEERDVRQK